jgi:hypothetical protein
MKKSFVFCVAALLSSTAAQAEWRVAESGLMKVYSEEDEATLRQEVTNLERYDRLLRAFSNTTKKGSPVKITVFLLRDLETVAASRPFENYGVGGYYSVNERGPFYIGTRRGVRAATTIKTAVDNSKDWGVGVLQHEYTHHFMYQYFPGLYPTWYSEGFAEFYGSLEFKPDNVIELGHAPMYRMDVIRSGWYPMRKLLVAKSYADVGDNTGNLYAQGWLLTHYAAKNPERGKQLTAYLKAVSTGTPYIDAAKAAFGEDIGKLDDEMKAHAKGLTAWRMSIKPIDIGPISIRKLSQAESDMLKTEMRLNSGYKRSDLPQVVNTGRQVVAKYPNDVPAMTTLMEVERLAGNPKQSSDLADKILSLQSDHGKAMMYKSLLQAEALAATKSSDVKAWDAVRSAMVATSKKYPNIPQLLEAYYDTYVWQGITPPAGAQNALMKAHELLPGDDDMTYKLASDFEKRGLLDDAIYMISPEAFGISDEDNKKNDPKKKERDRKQLEEFAVKYTFLTVRESAKDMYDRLIKKKEAADAAAKKTT